MSCHLHVLLLLLLLLLFIEAAHDLPSRTSLWWSGGDTIPYADRVTCLVHCCHKVTAGTPI